MSSSQTNYKLDEAQAIFNELRSIKKAISTGEKERQDLIQVSLFSPFFFKDHVDLLASEVLIVFFCFVVDMFDTDL